METRKPISHIAAGLLIAGIVIAVSILMMLVSKNASNPGGGWLTYLIIIAGLIFLINTYGKANNNQVSFGNLFSYGFKATAVFTVIFVGFLVLSSFIFPEFKDNAIDAARIEMEKQKNLSDEDADRGLAIVEKNFWAIAIGGTTLSFVILGAVGSLLGAALTKKQPQNPFEQQPQ